MKLCKDCKHSRGVTPYQECWHPKNMKPDHSIDELIQRWKYCSTLRKTGWFESRFFNYCGRSARWFEPREGSI